jgi:hypothetical protein
MREIKFRAWNDEDKTMSYGHEPIYWLSQGLYDFDKSLHLMEFTGLKDKIGLEIYEGDIVKENNVIGKIEYVRSRFLVLNNNETASYPNESCEIIGNIYENPDLIQE